MRSRRRAPAAARAAGAVADDPLVVFTPSGRRGRFPSGTPLLAAARRLGVDLDSVCGGRGICTRCQVQVGEGEFAKHGIVSTREHLTGLSDRERRQLATGRLKESHRLSCQARIAGDLVADVPETSQVHRQIVRKRAAARNIRIDPVVRPMYVEVPPPDLARPAAHLRRLKESLREAFGVRVTEADSHVLAKLHSTLEASGYRATAFVRDRRRLADIRPGFRDKAYGLAVDVGSTTLAVHLCDLLSGEVLASLGRMNPQIRFGEDLMSRVSFAMMNEYGAAEMTEAVRGALDGLAREAAAEAGIDPADVLEVAIAGNPVMHHLLLGLDPAPLGFAPFALATDEGTEIAAADIGLDLGPATRAYALPCIAGHVGADAAGVVLSEMPYRKKEVTLIVDVGTNAELVLGSSERLLAASSPTGPAFEGAPVELRATGRARGHRAGSHRPGDPRAALPGHRGQSLVGRAGLRPCPERDLRLRDRGGDRRALPRRHRARGRLHRRVARGPFTTNRARRADLHLRAPGR